MKIDDLKKLLRELVDLGCALDRAGSSKDEIRGEVDRIQAEIVQVFEELDGGERKEG